MNSAVDQPNWEFRCEFVRPYCIMGVGVSLGLTAFYYADAHFRITARPIGLLGVLLTTWLIMPVVVAVVNNYLTIAVNSTRVRGSDSWGWYFDLPWDDIADVRVISMAPLHQLGLRSHATRREMNIPLFLTEMEHFFLLATEFTQPDTPLHQFARAWLKVRKIRSDEPVPIRYYYH